MKSLVWLRWLLGATLVLVTIAAPYVYYRHTYTHAKRLRVVEEGKVYRSGCLTADGLRDAIGRLGIRTVLNLQDEVPDPELPQNYFARSTVRESAVCAKLGARMVFLAVDTIPTKEIPLKRPAAIDRFLQIMDDPDIYPVLIHCRAGLHRTGVLVAVYRMEYEGWTAQEALRELKGHGFGEFAATAANDYVYQYVLTYQPRPRNLNPFRGHPVRPTVGQLTSQQK